MFWVGSAYAGLGLNQAKVDAKLGKGEYVVKHPERNIYKEEFGRKLKWFVYKYGTYKITYLFYSTKSICIIYDGILTKEFLDFIPAVDGKKRHGLVYYDDDIIMKAAGNRKYIFWTKDSRKLILKNIKEKK